MLSRAETVIAASSFEHGRIVFGHIQAFVGEKLADRKRWRVWNTAQSAQIQDRLTGVRVRCIGSDPRRAHGLVPALVICDEPAQWAPSTAECMMAPLETAMGKIPDSRLMVKGIRPADYEHFFAKLLTRGNSLPFVKPLRIAHLQARGR